jgi:hypothetical protein
MRRKSRKGLSPLLREHFTDLRRKRRIKRLWYVAFCAPCVLLMLAGTLSGNDFIKWIGSISFGGALASIIGTEITLYQIENLGFGSGMVKGFLETPLGEKFMEMVEKVDALLANVDEREVERTMAEVRRVIRAFRSWWEREGSEMLSEAGKFLSRRIDRKAIKAEVVGSDEAPCGGAGGGGGVLRDAPGPPRAPEEAGPQGG